MFETNIDFGRQLRSYREDKKLSQMEFGKIISYSQAELSKIENGKVDITINQYFHIIRSLEIYFYLNYLWFLTKLKIRFLLIFKHKLL